MKGQRPKNPPQSPLAPPPPGASPGDTGAEQHGMQTNRWLGEWTMHAHGFGPLPEKGPPEIPYDSGSVNHRDEASTVALAIYPPGTPQHDAAFSQAMQRQQQQLDYGHQCLANAIEFFTDSHGAIHCRAQASGLRTCFDRVKQGHDDYRPLFDLYLQWWGGLCWLVALTAVSRGPMIGRSFGVGARYAKGFDDTREACAKLARGIPTGKGPQYFENAKGFQDTFASLLARDLAHDGAFNGMRIAAPTMPVSYSVDRFLDGHVTSAGDGNLGPGNPTQAWIQYSTGKTGTGAPTVSLGIPVDGGGAYPRTASKRSRNDPA